MNNQLIQALLSGRAGGLMGMLGGGDVARAMPGMPGPSAGGWHPPMALPQGPPLSLPRGPGDFLDFDPGGFQTMPGLPEGHMLNILPPGSPRPFQPPMDKVPGTRVTPDMLPNMLPNDVTPLGEGQTPWGSPLPMQRMQPQPESTWGLPMPMPRMQPQPEGQWGLPMPMPRMMPPGMLMPPGAGGGGMNNKSVLLDYINRIMQSRNAGAAGQSARQNSGQPGWIDHGINYNDLNNEERNWY